MLFPERWFNTTGKKKINLAAASSVSLELELCSGTQSDLQCCDTVNGRSVVGLPLINWWLVLEKSTPVLVRSCRPGGVSSLSTKHFFYCKQSGILD